MAMRATATAPALIRASCQTIMCDRKPAWSTDHTPVLRYRKRLTVIKRPPIRCEYGSGVRAKGGLWTVAGGALNRTVVIANTSAPNAALIRINEGPDSYRALRAGWMCKARAESR